MILPDAALAQHIAITGRTIVEHRDLLLTRYAGQVRA